MEGQRAGGRGPLRGTRVVELAGIGPAPFAAMVLADLGAAVVRVDRPPPGSQGWAAPNPDVLARGRRSVAVDAKTARGRDVLLRLVGRADVLLEGFRPGVAERLGCGPDQCLATNPRLIYGRMTGWGQDGPWSGMAGHDLDYIAVAGALHPIGPAGEPPPVPLNYIGDFGGGGMLLALGVLAALVERGGSGQGQVVDAAMLDGAALQTAMLHGLLAAGVWSPRRHDNLLDGAAPFYRCYACADGGFVAVAALEPAFWGELLQRLGLEPDAWPQEDRARWADQAERLEEIFAGRSRDEWAALFAGTDACVAPVLSPAEAPDHPQVSARRTFVEVGGVRQPAPAPRFSRTPAALPSPPALPGQHTDAVLAELGYDAADVAALRAAGAVF